DDAARLHALADLFPGRTREQLITDLLGSALQEVAAAMPYVAGSKVISTDEQGDPVYEDVGLTPRFTELTRKYNKSLDKVGRDRAHRPCRITKSVASSISGASSILRAAVLARTCFSTIRVI